MLDLDKVYKNTNTSIEIIDKIIASNIIETVSSLFDKCGNLIDNNDYELNSKICRLLSAIKHTQEKNKSNKLLKYLAVGTTVYLFPCVSAISYISIKGVKKINEVVNVKNNKNKRERNFKIFLNLFIKLGFNDKFDDLNYEPSVDELENICELYNKSTGGDDLIKLLCDLFQ